MYKKMEGGENGNVPPYRHVYQYNATRPILYTARLLLLESRALWNVRREPAYIYTDIYIYREILGNCPIQSNRPSA